MSSVCCIFGQICAWIFAALSIASTLPSTPFTTQELTWWIRYKKWIWCTHLEPPPRQAHPIQEGTLSLYLPINIANAYVINQMITVTVRHCRRRHLRPRRLVRQDLHPTFLPPTQPRQALPTNDLRYHGLRRCIQSPQYSPLHLGM